MLGWGVERAGSQPRFRSAGLVAARQKRMRRSSIVPAGAAGVQTEQDPRKPCSEARNYKHVVLRNGLRALLVQDTKIVFAAACANVQAGYFDDPLDMPGTAHYVEHAVHLGSEAFPDEKEYKHFLAQHGGSSNASTGMAHTRYHLRVHQDHLPGALSRLGAMLSAPLLNRDSALREVENIQAEYSRNCNLDSRKLLQLRRSLGLAPYSSFSTGSITTLRDDPLDRGQDPIAALKQLWSSFYTADNTTVAVIAPQDLDQQLLWLEEAFTPMRTSGALDAAAQPEPQPSWAYKYPAQHQQQQEQQGQGQLPESQICEVLGQQEEVPDQQQEESSSSSSTRSSSSSLSSNGPAPTSRTGDCTAIASNNSLLAPAAAAAAGGGAAAADVGCREASREAAPSSCEGPIPSAAAAAGGGAAAADVGWSVPGRDAAPSSCKGPNPSAHRYPEDVFGLSNMGQLVKVAPMRQLRQLQLVWYLPFGLATYHRSKPWSWASHVLGHEGHGSVAHLLKQQHLLESLSSGLGDEVRLGRGWMTYTITAQLSAAGEAEVEHVVASIYRAISCLRRSTEEERRVSWQEAAELRRLRWEWRDPPEPLDVVQSGALNLHYYGPEELLTGPVLMQEYDSAAVQRLLECLVPERMLLMWSSRRWKGKTSSKEQWYGADYSREPLPQELLERIREYEEVDAVSGAAASGAAASGAAAGRAAVGGEPTAGGSVGHCAAADPVPKPGELHLPEKNWAIPKNLPGPQLPGGAAGSAAGGGWEAPPKLVLQAPGLCCWHRRDDSTGLPKSHIRCHLVTPAVYATPSSTITARMLVKLLEELLLPAAYHAELAGSSYSLCTEQQGLELSCRGFTEVLPVLLQLVLRTLAGLTLDQVDMHFVTLHGRMAKHLTNWEHNNPSEHASYAAEHLLQQHHHHVDQLAAALEELQPQHVLQLAKQLTGGSAAAAAAGGGGGGSAGSGCGAGGLHVDVLVYGAADEELSHDVCHLLQQHLALQPIAAASWPLNQVLMLSSHHRVGTTAAAAAAGGSADVEGDQGSVASTAPGSMTIYQPTNPNPSNKNSAIHFLCQVGVDEAQRQVLVDLLVSIAAKPAFHALRTQQRLGYSVALFSHKLHQVLSVVVRVQSPSTEPARLQAAVAAWLVGFKAQLEALPAEELKSHQRALREKYLQPPKSLREAAGRAWHPIHSRSLDFRRRQQKAALVEDISLDTIVQLHETYLAPMGSQAGVLCTQIWPGKGTESPAASPGNEGRCQNAGRTAEGAEVGAGSGVDACGWGARHVQLGGVASFKQAAPCFQQVVSLP